MVNAVPTRFVAECYWAGVQQADLHSLDRRIDASLEAVVGEGEPVRYLGWLLVIDDEVVLVLFEGSGAMVRRVVEHAEIPFGRILQVAYAPWPRNSPAEEAMT